MGSAASGAAVTTGEIPDIRANRGGIVGEVTSGVTGAVAGGVLLAAGRSLPVSVRCPGPGRSVR